MMYSSLHSNFTANNGTASQKKIHNIISSLFSSQLWQSQATVYKNFSDLF